MKVSVKSESATNGRPTPGAYCDGCGRFVAVVLTKELPPMFRPLITALEGQTLELPGAYVCADCVPDAMGGGLGAP